jgi:hypothetical protein
VPAVVLSLWTPRGSFIAFLSVARAVVSLASKLSFCLWSLLLWMGSYSWLITTAAADFAISWLQRNGNTSYCHRTAQSPLTRADLGEHSVEMRSNSASQWKVLEVEGWEPTRSHLLLPCCGPPQPSQVSTAMQPPLTGSFYLAPSSFLEQKYKLHFILFNPQWLWRTCQSFKSRMLEYTTKKICRVFP